MELPRNTDPSASTRMAGGNCCDTRKLQKSWVQKNRERLTACPAFLSLDYSSTGTLGQSAGRRTHLPEAQHILHVVQAPTLVGQETGGPQGTGGKIAARGGSVSDFEALADTGKHDRMLTHDVTSSHRRETDGVRSALTGMALTGIQRIFCERPPARLCHDFSHLERSA